MATIERIWDIQGYSGGESDDLYRGPANSFYSGENIEIRKNLSGVQLASKLTDTAWSVSGTIIAMENLETLGVGTSSGVITCTSSGLVYLNGVLKQTISTGTTEWNQIIGIWLMTVSGTQYIYYVTKTSAGSGKIHRSTTDLATWNISYKSYTVPTSTLTRAFCINVWSYLHIGIKNKIISIYTIAETMTDSLTLPEKEEITGFTQFQNTFKVYTKLGNSGVQYEWDGSAVAPSYRQVWENLPVLGVVNDGAFDYAVLGFSSAYSGLYLIQGTQKQELRVNLEASAYSRLLAGYLSIRKWMLYISGGGSGESSNYGVYTYGSYYAGTPKSLVQQYSGTTNLFYMHCHSTAESYFACADGKVYYIEHNNPATTTGNATSGYLVTQIYQGNIWEEKAISKIEVGFKLETGTSIALYLRTTMWWSWTLVKTIDNATYSTKKKVRISKTEIMGIWLGQYNEIQMKIVLNWSSYYTPTVLRVTTFMEVLNQ